MNKNSKVIVVIVIIVIVVLGIYFFTKKEEGSISTVPVGQSTTAPMLFADSPLSKNAYLISTPTLDSKAEEATMGFTITNKTLPDGSLQVSLTSMNKEYK